MDHSIWPSYAFGTLTLWKGRKDLKLEFFENLRFSEFFKAFEKLSMKCPLKPIESKFEALANEIGDLKSHEP